MRKLSLVFILVSLLGNLAVAQTSTALKKETVMSDGKVVTDLNTGEVLRTAKGAVQISEIENTDAINFTATEQADQLPNSTLLNVKNLQGNGGTILINTNTQTPNDSGNNTNRSIDHINTPPINTNDQVSPK